MSYSFSTRDLKKQLLQAYPDQLLFEKPNNPTQSELVYSKRASFTTLSKNSDALTSDDSMNSSFALTLSGSEQNVLFHAAMQLRQDILEHPTPSVPWPPSSQTLSLQNAENSVCKLLFNSLALATNLTDDIPNSFEFVNVDQQKRSKLLSICQDIMTLSRNGNKPTPKSIALGMTLKHLTGSSHVVKLLSSLGHCMSYDRVNRLETAIATKELSNSDQVPDGFQQGILTVMVFDNIDFTEETLSGAGSTHNMNGIMFQRHTQIAGSTVAELTSTPVSKRKKSFVAPVAELDQYFSGQRQGLSLNQASASISQEENHMFNSYDAKEQAYLFAKVFHAEQKLPSWTGYNKLKSTHTEPLKKSTLHYLPMIEGNPNDLSVVQKTLQISIDMADKLNMEQMVVVFDQALYSKAQQIRWKDSMLQRRLIPRMGEFHTCMAFMATIGKMFKFSGLEDILIEARTVAPGSINGVVSGHMFNRALRSHKLLYEALGRLQVEHFVENTDVDVEGLTNVEDDNLHQAEVYSNFQDFVTKQCSERPIYSLWNTYLTLVRLLLTFIRATRESNWDLHVLCLRRMLPWFFAFDRQNYARYVSTTYS